MLCKLPDLQHHIRTGCRFCLVEYPPRVITEMIILDVSVIPPFTLQEGAMGQSSGTEVLWARCDVHPQVPGMRLQKYIWVPTVLEDTVRGATSLTLPRHSWWLTGPNASLKLKAWKPLSLPNPWTVPAVPTSLISQKGLYNNYMKISAWGTTL